MADPSSRSPQLRLVGSGCEAAPEASRATIPDTEWAILMAHAQDGDRAAYQRLLREITPYLRSLAARRHRDPGDIEDAVQDVLLTVHAIRHTFDPTRPFGPWLVTIAKRRFIDRLRSQGRRRRRELPLAAEHEAVAALQVRFDEGSDRRELKKAIDELPPMQRQAVHLLRLREMSLKEASQASGMSIASLKVNVHRAVKNLRRMLGDRSET
ncbi:Sigma-24 (FecI-like) [Bradyrhizobium sp. ORS 375]|uniref:RNA polymerase sigma factor n=1 Tax=Bradyrhizobium sp. (strain ORS 375) TaxID=566679 RepID=UPI0002409631|nr:sigma-70 family RNA polymerase sigma factor [Bradyrhizobium sp. ORS 375]CCD92175.1 Sigma-24 (FecI-like) [Bradyrhizobium sp. ORS 375]